MGATGWISRVHYQPDIAAALEQARWDAFRSGHYYKTDDLPQARQMTEDEFVGQWLEEWPPQAEQAARIAWRAAQQDPDSPDPLLASQPYARTRSVIDMTGIADTPTIGEVASAPQDLLDAAFAIRSPSTDQVEAAIAELLRSVPYDRDCGMYVIGCRDQTPDTIFFLGFSGDRPSQRDRCTAGREPEPGRGGRRVPVRPRPGTPSR